jgi:hypothetical protein
MRMRHYHSEETQTTLALDANNGLGHPASVKTMRLIMDKVPTMVLPWPPFATATTMVSPVITP